jgi:hypothetical protein
MAGPKYSNRTFSVYDGKEINLKAGNYIIEAWQGRDFKENQDIEGAIDIKVYVKDDAAPYGKGDQKAFFRVFENTGQKKTKTIGDAIKQSNNIYSGENVTKDVTPDEMTKALKEEFDDEIPF